MSLRESGLRPTFPIFSAAKKRRPSADELMSLRNSFPAMLDALETGYDPRSVLRPAELRYLLQDLVAPLEVWPPLRQSAAHPLEARRLATSRALLRAQRALRFALREAR
jgi:hypothetical protein